MGGAVLEVVVHLVKQAFPVSHPAVCWVHVEVVSEAEASEVADEVAEVVGAEVGEIVVPVIVDELAFEVLRLVAEETVALDFGMSLCIFSFI